MADIYGFERDTFTFEGKARDVYRRGSGPAVVICAEMPGITPAVLLFARKVAKIGCTAVLPNLFGEAGVNGYADYGSLAESMTRSFAKVCIDREFTILMTGKTSPVVKWLRALAAREHERCGGPGVGAVGMCFTGGYALAMAVDDRLLAPVLAQPSLPAAIFPWQRRSIDVSKEDLAVVKQRCANGLKVLGLRFTGDAMVPKERFEYLRDELGDGFIGIEIPSQYGNPDALIPPHSVLTYHLIDKPGEPTRDALDQVLELFRSRLLAQ